MIDLTQITGIEIDSRRVQPGNLFAALSGHKVDGRDYIVAAVKAGATHVLAEEGTVLPEGVNAQLILADDVRAAAAHLAAAFYAPAPQKIVAVTGTNGKTSTAVFTQQIWDMMGFKSAAIGTLGVVSAHYVGDSTLTTPDSVSLHKTLQAMAGAGVNRVVMEASSIGIDQRRMDGVVLSAAAYTNLTQDHLDYHGDMDTYLAAKERLFDLLPDGASAVICVDDAGGKAIAQCHHGVTYGFEGDVKIVSQTPLADGQRLEILADGVLHDVHVPLTGLFQGLNALCAALLVAGAEGLPFADVAPFMSRLSGVRGRLEFVAGHPMGAGVYVDYAHTPAGLESMLQAVRPHVTGRLICVFGCGGDRDAKKRPLMAKAVAQYADVAVLTDDNPRTENPADIRAQARVGAPDAIEIGDRRAAIRHAVDMLKAGDILVIAGKGHEMGQIIGTNVLPFDDVTEAAAAIKEFKHAV